MKRFSTLVCAFLLLFALTGCKSTHNKASGEAMPVNAHCCMQDTEAVKAGVTTVHKGTTVGFCCNMCKGAFEKLSESEKDAKVAALKKE